MLRPETFNYFIVPLFGYLVGSLLAVVGVLLVLILVHIKDSE